MKIVADHRNMYRFAIFMIGLHVVLSLVQITADSLAGFRFYLFSEYFVQWFILINIISIAVHLILIGYFRIKRYKFALITLHQIKCMPLGR